MYTELISKEPHQLSHYTELAHYYVLKGEFSAAEKVLRDALAAFKLSTVGDQPQYFAELWKIYVRQYAYPEETSERKIRAVCRELVEAALTQNLWNQKAIRNYLKQMDQYDKAHGG